MLLFPSSVSVAASSKLSKRAIAAAAHEYANSPASNHAKISSNEVGQLSASQGAAPEESLSYVVPYPHRLDSPILDRICSQHSMIDQAHS